VFSTLEVYYGNVLHKFTFDIDTTNRGGWTHP